MAEKKNERYCRRIVWHYDSSGVQAYKKYFGSMYEPIPGFCVQRSQELHLPTQADIEVAAKNWVSFAKLNRLSEDKRPTVY